MPRRPIFALCLVAALTASAQTAAPPLSLADQIAQILADPQVARDHWGIYVTTMDGAPIYALNEGQLFQPASNAKLFTTAAALALLGPNRRVETRVIGALDQATGVVRGDLTLAGGGDANLDSQDLPYVSPADRPKPTPGNPAAHQSNPMHDINDLVAQLVTKGVKRIDGDVVGDDTLFPWEPYAEDWTIDDAVWGYAAPVSALTIADNQLRITIAPGPSDQPASITLEQKVPYYTVQNDTRTVATKTEATGVQISRTIGSRVLRVFGSIAVKDEADVEHVAIDDPAEYAAMVLRAALIEHHIAVTGVARPMHRPAADGAGFLAASRRSLAKENAVVAGREFEAGSCLVKVVQRDDSLARVSSQPLASDVTFTNKVSENLHAELLLHELGRREICSTGSGADGARLVRAFLIHAGLDPNDFVLFDGSGLSGHDLVTPRATAKLLAYAATQPWFAVWKASLPVAGEDGTLGGRLAKPPLKGHVFAKTGTLSETRALSGYLDAANGRSVIFSVMVGNHLPGTYADRDAIDRIVAAIQATQ